MENLKDLVRDDLKELKEKERQERIENLKVVDLVDQLLLLEQQVVLIVVTLEKEVGVIVGIHLFIQKKVHFVLMIL
jgi:hypothetical protein